MAADPSTSIPLLAPHKMIACRKWFHSRSPSHRKSRPWYRAHLALPSRVKPPTTPAREEGLRQSNRPSCLAWLLTLAAGVVVGKGWRGYECRRQGEGFCHSSMQLCSASDSSRPGPTPTAPLRFLCGGTDVSCSVGNALSSS